MIGPILRRAEAGIQPGFREAILLFQAAGADYARLLQTAGGLTRGCDDRPAQIRTVLAAGCESDPADLIRAIDKAERRGCRSVMLQGGGRLSAAEIADLVTRIKRCTEAHLRLALGERPYADYAAWRRAGADQYLLPHDTSDPVAYAQRHDGRPPSDRLARYLWLRGLGYEIGGGLAARPTGPASLISEIEVLLNAAMDTVAIEPGEDLPDLLRLVAVVRICLPEADIWVQSTNPEVQSKVLSCGANTVVVPDLALTPQTWDRGPSGLRSAAAP